MLFVVREMDLSFSGVQDAFVCISLCTRRRDRVFRTVNSSSLDAATGMLSEQTCIICRIIDTIQC